MEFNLLDIVQHVLNIVVLYIIIRALVYKPVRSYMQQRDAMFLEKQAQTAQALEQAQALQEKHELLLQGTKQEAREMADRRLELASANAEKLVAEAKEKAAQLLQEARAQVNQETQEARKEMQDQIAALAMDLAVHILGREISKEDNSRLIDEYFEKVS